MVAFYRLKYYFLTYPLYLNYEIFFYLSENENEFFLVINNPLWVPILIKSIVVETPNFPEVAPSFKNIWTIPLNDNTEALIKHLYKRIKDKDCLNTDIVLVQPIDWKVGKLTDVKRD